MKRFKRLVDDAVVSAISAAVVVALAVDELITRRRRARIEDRARMSTTEQTLKTADEGHEPPPSAADP